MRTSNADRLALLFLLSAALLGLFGPSLAANVRQHVLPEQSCVQIPAPTLAYCPAQAEFQPGEQR
ncbi:hypothetical protein AB0G98_24520 [Streptomyces sp. NPDC020196]|uniref:hypothetical protein n=1 Tax=Streptomyces sp. NPDC020196 TaxID=3156656 RepID=UPI0033CA3CE4